jgi:putative oxidoreductase
MKSKLFQTSDARYLILIRMMTGFVFLFEGIQKFLFEDTLGVGRFIKIGIPYPEFSANFVGIIEISAGILLLIGLCTRVAALLLFINISVAIISTKFPMLHNSFWTFAHEGRTDFCMLIGTFILMFNGGGKWSADKQLTRNDSTNKN